MVLHLAVEVAKHSKTLPGSGATPGTDNLGGEVWISLASTTPLKLEGRTAHAKQNKVQKVRGACDMTSWMGYLASWLTAPASPRRGQIEKNLGFGFRSKACAVKQLQQTNR